MTKIFTIPIVAALAIGCGGGGSSRNDGATDVQQEDVAADQATDPADDPAADAVPDGSPDAGPDPSDDPPEEWPTDLPADWPVETSSACDDAGGFCTAERWDMCPPGYEPTAPDMIRGCGGMCCVPAPFSTCSETPIANCIVGESCTGCWGDPDGMFACEEGRICCSYYCE